MFHYYLTNHFKMKYILILMVFTRFYFTEAKLITYFDKFELCYLNKNGPLWSGNIRVIRNKNENSYITGEGEFYRDLVSSKLKVLMNITKCASRESLDYCEPLTVLKPTNPCFFFGLKNTAWEPFVNGFSPPFKCPIKKGKMFARNLTLDGNLFDLFPLQDINWKGDLVFFENNIKLIQYCVELRFIKRY